MRRFTLMASMLAVVAAALLAVAPTAMAVQFTRTITVPANTFTSSGVVLGPTDTVSVTATGTWDYCGGSCTVGPDGTSGFLLSNSLLPTANIGALIGSVDNQATWSLVGSGPTTIHGPGTLQFGLNDLPGATGDNSGSLTVTITGGAPVQLADVLAAVQTTASDVVPLPDTLAKSIFGKAVTGLATDSQTGNFDKVCSDVSFMKLVIDGWSGSALMTTAQANAILNDLDQISAAIPCST